MTKVKALHNLQMGVDVNSEMAKALKVDYVMYQKLSADEKYNTNRELCLKQIKGEI